MGHAADDGPRADRSAGSVVEIVVPPASLCASALSRIDYADAYAIDLPRAPGLTVDDAVDAAFASFPRWVAGLMALRDSVVAPFGLKVSQPHPSRPRGTRYAVGETAGIFRVVARADDEILFGEDDRHLDFRAGFQLAEMLTLSTVVRFHNLLGRAYFFPVAPAHRRIVRSMLRATRRHLVQAATAPDAGSAKLR